MEWCWKMASGLGLDRNKTKGEVTYKYSGEQLPFAFSALKTYIPILVGAGRVWHAEHADPALELSGMLPCYLITDREFRIMTHDYSMYLTFHYRWRT